MIRELHVKIAQLASDMSQGREIRALNLQQLCLDFAQADARRLLSMHRALSFEQKNAEHQGYGELRCTPCR